jgi:acyl-CoA hydrolase
MNDDIGSRTVAPADIDFTRLVRPGDTIMWSQGAGEPIELIEKLLSQRHDIGLFNAFLGASYSNCLRPEHADVVRPIGMGAVGSNLALCRANVMDVVPCHLSALPRLLQDGALPIDIVIMQCSEFDAQGRASFGAVNGYAQFALERARLCILQVNPHAPKTFSRIAIDCSRFDIVTSTDRPLVTVPSANVTDIDMQIARHIAGLITDGDTLQIGIGAVPSAVLAALKDHRHLGFHSGVLGDGVMHLMETGVIDNSRKSVDVGVAVAGALTGSSELYQFADANPAIAIEAVSYTHAIDTLAAIDDLVSVNSAIEVDLTGQAGSEVIGSSYLGTIGGQIDFIRGANASKGGRSIIGLPSRTSKGAPRIVPQLQSGVATIPRSDAHFFVTEYGAADLRGLSISNRVKRMISIAHPDDRDELQRAAANNVVGYRAFDRHRAM